MIGHINCTPQILYPLKDDNQINIFDSDIKADLFLNLFCPLPTSDTPPTSVNELEKEIEEEVNTQINNNNADNLSLPFTDQELKVALSKLKSKSTGLDRTSNTMLVNLSPTNRKSLLKLYNLFFETGYVPPSWKTALVVPITKSGKPPDKINSYRPISLTSCIGNCMEKLVNNRLKWHLEQYGFIPTHQAGFREGCSTID